MNIIEGLHPNIRLMTYEFLKKAQDQGIELKITFGKRTFEEQQALYDQGRTKPGKIVTKAKPGQSYHNYGLAIDVVPIVNKKAIWDNEELWQKIGLIGESVGFEWGGRFKNLVDKPHFQFPKGIKYNTLLQKVFNKEVDINGYVILSL